MKISLLVSTLIFFLGANYFDIAILQNSYYSLRRSLMHKKDQFLLRPILHLILYLLILTLALLGLFNSYLYFSTILLQILYLILTTKGRLKLSRRALSLYLTKTILVSSLILTVYFLAENFYLFTAAFPLVSFFGLLLTYYLLYPLELLIQNHYFKKARKRLDSHKKLTVIGITGSFGKTTTRHFLSQFLADLNPLSPSGNINTPLGLCAYINNNLSFTDRYLIVEIGIDQKGGMKKFKKFLKLDIAVITAIGSQHLRTFKTIENIKKEKLAIASLLRKGGKLYYNEDDITEVKKLPDILYQPLNKNGYSIYTMKEQSELVYLDQALLQLPFTSSLLTFDSYIAYKVALNYRSSDRLKTVYQRLVLPKRRKNLIKNGPYTIIDDSYNINAISAKDSIAECLRLKGPHHIITSGLVENGGSLKAFSDFINSIKDFDLVFFMRRPRHQEKKILDAILKNRYQVLTDIKKVKSYEANLLILSTGTRYTLR